MGSVAVKFAGSWVFEGDNITVSAVCLYCDKCGSFRLVKIPGRGIFLPLAVAVLRQNAAKTAWTPVH